jgi:hypothetical protein
MCSTPFTVSSLCSYTYLLKRLRERYVHEHRLLPPTGTLNDISVASTFIQRTIQSTQSLLTGLGGNENPRGSAGRLVINTSEHWGRMVPDLAVNERQEKLERAFWQTPRAQEVEDYYTPVRQRLSQALIEGKVVHPEALDEITAGGSIRDFDFIPCVPTALSWKQGGDDLHYS